MMIFAKTGSVATARGAHLCLLNSAHIEVWPAQLTRTHLMTHERIVAQSDWVLRRKQDRQLVAAQGRTGLRYFVRRWNDAATIQAGLELIGQFRLSAHSPPTLVPRSAALQAQLRAIGIDSPAYQERTGLVAVAEPSRLYFAGMDRYQRPIWLTFAAGRAWQRMAAQARQDHITLEVVSSYRSYDYQLQLILQKRARAQSLAAILRVNAVPGFSEHHSGCALDLSAPGMAAATEEFDTSDAFQWLSQHGHQFGFSLSYPRDNPYGILYEPWHWCWRPAGLG